MRFSIVIPVYNVEKYIRKCMESVMNQTFRDYEVIVVDDESPDNSMQIVAEFAEKYPGMIKMIHQKNTRQGGARNRGVREARGEYLIFVDSDDYVSVEMLEFVDRKLREKDLDILIYQFEMVTPNGRVLGQGGLGSLEPGIYCPGKDKHILRLPANPVNKAFRREFYISSKMEFPEKLLYEDTVIRLLYVLASRIELCDEVLYYYVQSGQSSIRRKPSEKMLDIISVTDMVIDMFRKEGIYETYREELECSLIGGVVYILDVINKADHTHPIQEKLVDYILKNFPEYEKYPCMDEEMLMGLRLLCNGEYRAYHDRVIVPRELKRWLLSCKVIHRVNQIRWRIKNRLSGTGSR